jgi:hypothetical protein
MKAVIAALLFLFPSIAIPEIALHNWDYIGAPSKRCTGSYDVEDNDCYIEVLRKERIVAKKRIHGY